MAVVGGVGQSAVDAKFARGFTSREGGGGWLPPLLFKHQRPLERRNERGGKSRPARAAKKACLRGFTPRHYTGGNPVGKGQRAVLTRPANADRLTGAPVAPCGFWVQAGQGNTPPIKPHLIIKPQELRFTKLFGKENDTSALFSGI